MPEGIMEKLSWDQIEEQFDQEWVELVDYDWDMTQPDPSAGVVRVHSKDRREFDRLMLQDPPEDSAILFVGDLRLPENTFLSVNLHQYKK